MNSSAPLSDPESEEQDIPFKPLTAEEAQRLREEMPSLSPWWVVMGQVGVGFLVALAAWGVTGRQNVGWSAGYGALAVALPAAVFARGMTSRLSSMNAGAAAVGFMGWELVKIALTVALLAAAPRVVASLSWPAMLAGLIVTMKVYWVAMVFRGRRRS